MKTKALFLLLIIFALSGCTKQEIESNFENANIEAISIQNEAPDNSKSYNEADYTPSILDVTYNSTLNEAQINRTREYYFTKYSSGSFILSLSDPIASETHHEKWLQLSHIYHPTPGETPEGEASEDDRIDI